MSQAFAADCEAAAKGLRRVPADLRRALSSEVKEKVAAPLAGKIKTAASGPYARVLSAGTKARAGADPTIVVGGMRPKLSGGAGPRQVVFGTEWGGGRRRTAVPGRAGRRGYRRHSTRQFAGKKRPFVFRTVNANIDETLEVFADITMRVLSEGVS